MQDFKMTKEMIPMIRMGTKQAFSNKPITGEEVFIGEKKMRCLIYRAKMGYAPVIFNFHGGGFALGCAEMDEYVCAGLNQKLDATVINAEYTLAPEGAFPISINEGYDLIAYVIKNAKDFNINPNKVVVIGHSAGALLSAVVARFAKEKNNFKLKAAVLDYPPVDLKTPTNQKKIQEGASVADSANYDFFKTCYCTEEQASDPYCSPIFANSNELKGICPTLIITAGKDVLRNEGEKYAQNLKDAGVDVTLKRIEGVEHGFTLENGKDTQYAIDLMVAFLKKYI